MNRSCRGGEFPFYGPVMPIEQAHALHQSRVQALRHALAPLPRDGQPLALEIGCGHGHFLTAYAAAHPEVYAVGIDLMRERLERAGRKSHRLGLNNVCWVQGEAADVLEAWPAGVFITRAIFVLFPDPWPKRRHWKHRLIQPDLLSTLASRTRRGTPLCFRTDHAPYFAAASEIVQEHPDWDPAGPTPWPFEEVTVFQARAPGYQSFVVTRR